MPMEMLVTAGIEILLNQLLKADAKTALKLQSLKGKVLQVNITELPKSLYFIFSSQIDVLAKFDGEPDCCMDIKLSTLPRLQDSSQFTALIKEGALDMQGDPMVASKFSIILKELDIDWEEHLSRYTGDIAAHKLFQTAQSGQAWLQNNMLIARQNMAEYLIEEIRLAPGALEIADFCDEVSELDQYYKRLEMRLSRLSRKEDV